MLLEMKNISKDFGAVKALADVSFSVEPGQIHGLLGENGAGKTTLMNVLAGAFLPTRGEIIIDGRPVTGMTPHKSMSLGIRFIHQELNLCNDLTVYENMYLGEEISRNGWTDKMAMAKKAQEVLDGMRVSISATATVDHLEAAQKQLVEIAKALLFKSELIIMDEPTTALNNDEIENLFEIMRGLREQGVSFVYISHKMPELFAICDRYTVLRDGVFIESGSFSDIDEHRATELLIGKAFVDANLKDDNISFISPDVLLSVKNLSGNTFEDVNLQLHRGEVIAITGLQGAGSAELATALFGATPSTGEFTVGGGEPQHRMSIRGAMRRKIAMVPCNRKERGILPDLSIRDNNSVASLVIRGGSPFFSAKEELARYEKNRQKLEIKADNPRDPITSLSGGNQQKVIVGRWLETGADVYIMDNPTQGIDVGAKYQIYKLIVELAREGKGIIVFSTEFPEIWHIADRCLVMYKGHIHGDLPRSELTEVAVMAHSTGSNLEVLN